MFSSISISNFKRFKHIKISDLDDFNLVIGKNNVGKTALLEAIFFNIGADNPDLVNVIDGFRNLALHKVGDTSFWSSLFHNFKINKPIFISGKDDQAGSIILTITLSNEEGGIILPRNKDDKNEFASSAADISDIDRLKFEMITNNNPPNNSYLVIENEKLLLRKGDNKTPIRGMYVSSQAKGAGKIESERYSKLQIKNKHDIILKILQIIEPRLTRLVVVSSGPYSMLYGDIGIGEAIPLQYMGEGTSKLATIILAMSEIQNGTILIDEIDNGFHYSVQRDIVKAIYEYASELNIQIFATTHNNEFIENVDFAFNEMNSNNISIYKLFEKDNEMGVSKYTKENLESAIKSGLEIR